LAEKQAFPRAEHRVHHDCEHHVLLGQLDDYESYNPHVLAFVKESSGLTGPQIRADAAWQKAVVKVPRPLDGRGWPAGRVRDNRRTRFSKSKVQPRSLTPISLSGLP
jgi:hypothetical protein